MISSSKVAFFFLAIVSVSCSTENEEQLTNTDFLTPDWTESTHGKEINPNYTEVFPQDKVNTLEITMTDSDWEFIQADMEEKFGSAFGIGGNQPGGGAVGGGGIPTFGTDDPDYVAVSLKFNGLEWYKVGFRLKGNSTLSTSWRNGIYKLPFRLDFDEFEEQYAQIENQRFYGFNELSFSPGANDNTLIREKVGADIFRRAGIASSQTAFYKVFINFGSGIKYCGVYTMVEVVDDTMIKNQFGSDDGNIYKPESAFKSFIEDEFEKKNNKGEADFSDVQAAIAALNSSTRNTDAPQWRASLETSFNVDHFIKWLAVNTTMHNWDTYGAMAHNYYLYNDADKGLTWIPWDNNEAMSNRGKRSELTLSLSGISNSWPLIRYIADDPVYYANYKEYVHEFAEQVFTVDSMNELFDTYHNLISPYVIGPEQTEEDKHTHLTSRASFQNDLTSLKQHVAAQAEAVNELN